MLASDLSADRGQALGSIAVSRETLDRLDEFVRLLLTWQGRMNLIAPSTARKIWTRHVIDSLQLLPLAPNTQTWVDLGSGAGFPGLVIACVLAERAGARVHLVESNARKAAFLREAARVTGAPADVHNVRIEALAAASFGAQAVSARALAPLHQLLGYAEPFLKTGAHGLFLKGREAATELTEARKYWRIDADLVPSITDSDARIVLVKTAERLPGT